jgi:hypothetical protein
MAMPGLACAIVLAPGDYRFAPDQLQFEPHFSSPCIEHAAVVHGTASAIQCLFQLRCASPERHAYTRSSGTSPGVSEIVRALPTFFHCTLYPLHWHESAESLTALFESCELPSCLAGKSCGRICDGLYLRYLGTVVLWTAFRLRRSPMPDS